ncbi:hypothetical protein [Candidatus Accumulibacter sp. ACC012]|uniref:hypothetical protein n=1 Tax=Candidatus Accumulibacter sp. ACC012 TaxID=2823332 RepID=UPI003430304D
MRFDQGKGIENFATKRNAALDAPSLTEGFAKRNVINVPQLAPEQDQNGIEHGYLVSAAAARDSKRHEKHQLTDNFLTCHAGHGSRSICQDLVHIAETMRVERWVL